MNHCRYAIISGSTRPNSQSRKVADFISKTLLGNSQVKLVQIVDLALDIFPLWDEAIWSKGIDWHPSWAEVSKKLHTSDAIIVIAPEWNGMVPPQLMNFFQLCSHNELSHKPGLIVSVSSGQGGSYPIAELRMNSFKNTKICYIPEHVIVRDVNNVLNSFESAASDGDQYIRGRMQHALSLLNLYTEAFKPIREHEVVTKSQYPYGM
jgi:NAD(P)H-dependent FMN reductase